MTGGDIKRSLHRAVQYYASEQATMLWRGTAVRSAWSEANLAAVEELAQYILDLSDDDPRFAAVAVAYTGHERRLREPYPWEPTLGGWLGVLGRGSASALDDPDEFINRWSNAEVHAAKRSADTGTRRQMNDQSDSKSGSGAN